MPKPSLTYLPYKAIPTWEVMTIQGTPIYFNSTNGSVFEHPKDRATRVYNKQKERYNEKS